MTDPRDTEARDPGRLHPELRTAVERAQQLVDSRTWGGDVTMWLQEAQHLGDVLALAVAARR